MRDIYGATADAPAFRDAFARWLRALWSDGTEATLAPLPRMTAPVRDARPEEAAEIAALLRASIADLCAADHRNDAAVRRRLDSRTRPPRPSPPGSPTRPSACSSPTCGGRLAGVAAARRSGELLLLYVAARGAPAAAAAPRSSPPLEAWLRGRRRPGASASRAPSPPAPSTAPAATPRSAPPVRRRGAGGFPMLEAPRPAGDRRSSSSTATACSSTASRSRCACSSTPSPRAGLHALAGRGRRALPRPLARLDPRDRRPRLRRHRHRRRPRRHARAPSTPPSAPSSRRSPHIAETLDALPCPYCVASSSQPERVAALAEPSPASGRASRAAPSPRRWWRSGKPAPDLFLFAAETLGYRSRRLPRRRGQPGRHPGGEGRRHAGHRLHGGKPCRQRRAPRPGRQPRPRRDHRRHARSSPRSSAAEPGRPGRRAVGVRDGRDAGRPLPLLASANSRPEDTCGPKMAGGAPGTLAAGRHARDLDARRRRRHRHRQRPGRALRRRRPPPRPRRGAARHPRDPRGPRRTVLRARSGGPPAPPSAPPAPRPPPSPTHVAGLAFDATCSLVLRDAAGRPVTASTTGDDRRDTILWLDHRAAAEADAINAADRPPGARPRRRRPLARDAAPEAPLAEAPPPRELVAPRHRLRPRRLPDLRRHRQPRPLAMHPRLQVGLPRPRDPGLAGGLPRPRSASPTSSSAPACPRAATPVATDLGPLTPAAAADLGLTPATRVAAGLIDAHAGALGVLGHLAAAGDRAPPRADRRHLVLPDGPRRRPALRPRRSGAPHLGAALPGLWLSEGGQSASGALLDHLLRSTACAATPRRPRPRHRPRRRAPRAPTPDLAPRLHVLPDFHGNRAPLADPHALGVVSGLPLDASFDGLCRLYWRTCVGLALGLRGDPRPPRRPRHRRRHASTSPAATPATRSSSSSTPTPPAARPSSPPPPTPSSSAPPWPPPPPPASTPRSPPPARAMGQGGRRRMPDPASAARIERDWQAFRAMQRHRAELDRFG